MLLDAKWKWVQDTGRYNSNIKEDILVDILDLLDFNGLNPQFARDVFYRVVVKRIRLSAAACRYV